MSLISRLAWTLIFGTALFLILAFLGIVGLVPIEKGYLLTDIGFGFVLVLLFMELTSFKL